MKSSFCIDLQRFMLIHTKFPLTHGEHGYYEYSTLRHKWEKKEGITLSETERDVLRLSAQGYTMNDIADRLCKSVDTIKACKRNLFAKMGVKNIAEALFHATNYQMI